MSDTGKNILITGASSGIGEALAYAYAQKQCNLYLCGRDEKRLRSVADHCKSIGALGVETATFDIREPEALQQWAEGVDDFLSKIDIVIANAGISGGTSGMDMSELGGQIRAIFDVNINGVLNTILPVMSAMIKKESGKIVIISSCASFSPWPGAPAYASSKACVRVLGEALSGTLRSQGIGVSVICPGFISTPLTDKNDYKMPFKISASEAAKRIVTAVEKGKVRIAFPLPTYLFSVFQSLLPFRLQKWLLLKFPAKKSLKEE